MSQWGQPGYQYPLQTGFPGQTPGFQQNPQQPQFQQGPHPQFQQQGGFGGVGVGLQSGFGGGGIAPQPTGFPGGRLPQGFQQPQQTGFPGSSGPGFLQAQPTGFPGAGNFGQQARAPPPVPPIPGQFQQQQPTQQTGFPVQPTGFAGRAPAPLVPQVTGFVDPRLQLLSSSFMPANMTTPYTAGGAPQLAPPPQQQAGGLSLQQSFQQHNQSRGIGSAPKIPWALSKAEKKNYDQIFRAWDAQGTGFISGQTALEVFGQSGLDKNDLARIWTLADTDNRGKLNLAEFHVAMGIIYRRLNGNDIPDELPAELVPPSSRDLDTSVNFLKDILKNDTRARSPSGFDTPVSRLRDRSLHSTSVPGAGGRQDATVYKHTDAEPPGGFYQPRSRHLDRSTVRSRNDDDSPSADLSDMKRQLENTAKMLDQAAEADASRTAEDEALDREMSDLKYRIKRLQEDLEYVSRGPRSTAKDEERRRLERELLKMMHERLPEMERKIEDRQARKDREKREWARDRDRRNDRFGRYDDNEGRYSPSVRYRDGDDDRDRGYSRNGRYDRDDDRDRSYRSRDRSREREYDRERDRERERDKPRSPPPLPPAAAPSNSISKPPPPPPAPTASPAPSTKNMTPEERQVFIRAEAKRRLEARMQALGVSSPSSTASPTLDTSVEDRLAQEKKEAEEKAKDAEKQAEQREKLRRERLEGEKALKEGRTTPAPNSAPSPAPVAPIAKAPPPAPKARAPAPPPPRKGTAPRPPIAVAPPAPPAPRPPVNAPIAPRPPAPSVVPPPAVPQVDPEDEALKAREQALRKKREEREALLRKLEEEEEEARLAEEAYQSRRNQFLASKAAGTTPSPATPTPPVARSPAPPPPPIPANVQAPQVDEEATPTAVLAPPPPPPPLAPAPSASGADKLSTNPFSRLMKEGGGSTASTPSAASATNGSTNPFFRSQTAPPPSAPTPPKTPTPTAVKASYHTAPSNSEDEWDDVKERDDDDSSDDEFENRDTRMGLAQQLFGSILPPARPQSAGPTPQSTSNHVPPAPPAPAAPPAPVAPAPPPAPAPPAAMIATPTPSGDRGALLNAIQGGARLRKASTNDRSAASLSGKVLGDPTPPPHVSITPRPVSPPVASLPEPPLMTNREDSSHSKRQSVDWYAGLAADHGVVHHLPATAEEEEEELTEYGGSVPQIQVSEPSGEAAVDPLEDIDRSKELHVRSLYPYEGQRAEDLTFGENLILTAYPSKSGGDWWYGALARDGKSGFFPQTYVQVTEKFKAKALYSYAGGNADELPFAEGDELSIVDKSETDWWKAEQGGVVFIVPAAYLEIVEGSRPSNMIKDAVRDNSEAEDDIGHAETDDADDTDDSSDVDFLSAEDDSDSDVDPEATEADQEARETERQKVLEAAGLIVNQDVKPPPGVLRSRSARRPRPAPATPQRASIVSNSSTKELPSLPSVDPSRHLNDAFDRYETFKKTHGSINSRMSVSSIDTTPSSPPKSPAISVAPSLQRDGESRASHFLNFLGRSHTPATDNDKRTIPIISAPILNTPDTPSRESSPAFGSSWASLVDKSALDGIPKSERRRQETIFELITTEADYVRDLQLIVELFYSRLMSVLGEKATTVIFANIEDLLLINTTFLSSLEERQKDCRLYVDQIGDILHKHMSNMDVYLAYCVNQSNAGKVLQSMRDTNPELASNLQTLREDPVARSLDLSSYLLVPMQRMTRYPLLIRQILHYTEVAHDRDDITAALRIAEKILNHINETIRDQEGFERLKEISQNLWIGQGRLDLTAPTRHMGPRKLLKEGILLKAKSGRKLRSFLCSDILVLTDENAKTLYRIPISLSDVLVQDVPGRDDLGFRLVLAYPRGGDTISLRVTSVRDCQTWISAVESASKKCRNVEKRLSMPGSR